MRKLNVSDAFELSRTVKALGVKENIKAAAKADDQWEGGFEVIWSLFDLATEKNAEKEIYKFLARPFEMKPEDVESMDLTELIEKLELLMQENDLKRFFANLQRLMK